MSARTGHNATTDAGAAMIAAPVPVVLMKDLRFRWPGAESFGLSVPAFDVASGERLLLIGPSGSGKSTLLSLLCGIVAPDAGRLEILGRDIASESGASRDRFRAEHFGIVFQMFNLLPYASVLDNVLLPLSFARRRRARAGGPTRMADEARRLLARLGLEDSTMTERVAARLSVGQQQRVAAARALIGSPEIIVADEPTSALDRTARDAFLDLLDAEIARAGSTLVMVSHEEDLSPRFDRVVRLDEIVGPYGEVAR
ncbi:MAG: ABC transporter ATP-binding protein [Hyphomicrobiaceae bacterium]